MSELANVSSSLPAHIAAAFGGNLTNSDLTSGVSAGYPIISFKGKVWAVTENGEKSIIMSEDGENIAPSIRAVILGANPHLNKIYYRDGYEEGSTEKPTCYSNDSIAPAEDSVEKQAVKCGACQWNQWGSKITDNGAKGKACADARRLAVAPEGEMDRAMLLRVPAASLKDLMAYAEGLTKRGVPYQALVTQIGFDFNVAYPKLTFKGVRWLDAEEVAEAMEVMAGDTVANITAKNAVSFVDEPAAEVVDDFLPPGGPPAAVAPKRATKAAAKPAEVAAALAPAADAAPKRTGFGGAKPAAEPVQAQAPNEGASVKATVMAENVNAELDSVLGMFDDEVAED